MQSDGVSACENFFDGNSFYVELRCASCGEEGIESQDLHAKCLSALNHFHSDAANTNNTQSFAPQLMPHEM